MRTASALVALALLAVAPAAAAASSELAVPVDVRDDVNLAGPGLVAAAVLSTPVLDAAEVDPATIAVGDVQVAREQDGSLAAATADANGDGRDDLVVHVDKEKLDLGPDSDALTLTGTLRDGRAIRGSDAIEPEVALEVKLDQASAVQALLRRHRGADLTPLMQALPEARLAGLTARARARSHRRVPDMASWYRLTLPADADVQAVLAELRAMPEVAYAYPAADPAPPPETPDFTAMQGYFRPAPEGIDADFSHQDPRTRGAGIEIVDLEYDWNPFHEDLQLDWSSDLGGDVFPRLTIFADEHGTAVFGELVARENEYGVTGGVPDAAMFGISPTKRVSETRTRWLPAEAMVYAAQFLEPGDALLIEQQTVGPNGGTKYVPIEWMQSAFDATQMLTALGITVVATGGNGGENLDGPEFLGRFDRGVRDSGAIVVGAGSSTTHARLGFSVYGSRVDLQGWGHNITTTGSNGNLFGGTDPANRNFRYTRSFGGTSGAGSIVTSAVVAIQSYLEAMGQEPWSAARIADVLKRSGTPQGGDTSQHIGPLPNLDAALKEIEMDPPTTTAQLDERSYVTLTADDGWGRGIDVIEYRLDGRHRKTYKRPFPVLQPGEHTLEYHAVDLNGNAEEWKTLTFGV